MLGSAIGQVQNDVRRLQEVADSSSRGWSDVVSERVYGSIGALASNAGTMSSQLSSQVNILEGIKSDLARLAQF